VAAANRRDRAYALAAALVTELGRDLVVPDAVVVEVDQLLRSRVGAATARLFLAALAAGEHTVAFSTPAVLKRAVAFDAQFADLGLGYADAVVMAFAERERLPVLTFDFEHFRSAPPSGGFWQLVVDEHRYDLHTRT
jgi:predicted nucleic acid-binding protein